LAASAAAVSVSALNNVDLPTFGKPTIPQLNPILHPYILEGKPAHCEPGRSNTIRLIHHKAGHTHQAPATAHQPKPTATGGSSQMFCKKAQLQSCRNRNKTTAGFSVCMRTHFGARIGGSSGLQAAQADDKPTIF
jgi:hypothetical protein